MARTGKPSERQLAYAKEHAKLRRIFKRLDVLSDAERNAYHFRMEAHAAEKRALHELTVARHKVWRAEGLMRSGVYRPKPKRAAQPEIIVIDDSETESEGVEGVPLPEGCYCEEGWASSCPHHGEMVGAGRFTE